MTAVTARIDEGIGRICLDVPDRKHNVLSEAVLGELTDAIRSVSESPDVRGIVLVGKETGFCAGADVEAIAAVRSPEEARRACTLAHEAFASIESSRVPVVAAIRGPCLGGGLELALACHGMVAAHEPSVRIGLPEVRLGIVPGFGGTQRLPRRIGVVRALDLILTGRMLRAKKALAIGLIDDLVCPFYLEREARAYALALASGAPRRNEKARRGWVRWVDRVGPLRSLVLKRARTATLRKTRGLYPAPDRAIELVELAFAGDPDRGFRAEAEAVAELLSGEVARNLIRLFLASEALKRRGQGVAVDVSRTDTAVIGAGVMGADIARLLLERGARVRLIDVDAEGLARGCRRIADAFRADVRRGRSSRHEADRSLDRLEPDVAVRGLARMSMVVEAVVERMEVKQAVFRDLVREAPGDAALYSNTSSLSPTRIGYDAGAPGRVLGLHFFNPVARMPLVEVVVPDGGDELSVDRAAALARELGKTPVVVRDRPGFCVNRILAPYLSEALQLVEEGVPPDEVDRLMLDLGFAMGPLRVLDTVGLDVAGHAAESLAPVVGERSAKPSLGRILVER